MAGLELLSDQGYRIDGRKPAELRKVQARMGVFAQADGSAYLEQGNTKALAVVYGPHEVSSRMREPVWTRLIHRCNAAPMKLLSPLLDGDTPVYFCFHLFFCSVDDMCENGCGVIITIELSSLAVWPAHNIISLILIKLNS